MKEKILAELRKKYAGLPIEFLGFIAEKMAAKITEESAIEGAIAELENSPIPISDLAAQFQKEGDKRATDAANKREATLKEKYDLVEKKSEPAPKDEPKPEPQPANPEISELKRMLLEMKQEREATKVEEAKQLLFGKLKAKADEKKIPANFLAGKVVEKEEDIETVFARVESEYTAVKQHFIDLGMSDNSIPLEGSGQVAGGVSSMMQDYLKTKKTEQK